MPEPSNGQKKPREITMEQRLILAFILMGAVLFLSPYFMPAPQPAAPVEQTQATQQQPAAQAPAGQPGGGSIPPVVAPAQQPPPVPAPVPEVGQVAASREEETTVETRHYKVVFSNRGAVAKSWILKNYVDSIGAPLELVSPSAPPKVGYPFGIVLKGDRPALHPNDALFVATTSDDGLAVDFEYSANGLYAHKVFRFEPERHFVEVTSEIRRNGNPAPHLLAWRGGFGDHTYPNAYAVERSVYYDLAQSKRIDVTSAEGGQVTNAGTFSFAGVEDTYFAAVALPDRGATFEMRTFVDGITPAGADTPQLYVGAAVGGEGRNSFPIYIGPKDLGLLEGLDPRLTPMVNFGFFAILAKPLFLALRWIYEHVVPNWGWAIVLLTIAINFATLPLKYTSLKSMRKMQALQPYVKEINERYKGIGMRDPRKGKQNEEMMALYKKHGVNPMGGCLPMVLQIPFFFAFYEVLQVAIELRGAGWLWVTDLSQPEHLAIRVLPIVMVASQFASQKITPPSPGVDPNQQRMMMFMPLMFGFFFYGVSSGLVLYWLTSNVVGVAQQLAFNRFFAPDAAIPAASAETPKKKRPGKSR